MIVSRPMDAPRREPDIDPELLAQAARLGIDVAGFSESRLRLHLQKIDPAGAEERARRWPRRTPRRSPSTIALSKSTACCRTICGPGECDSSISSRTRLRLCAVGLRSWSCCLLICLAI